METKSRVAAKYSLLELPLVPLLLLPPPIHSPLWIARCTTLELPSTWNVKNVWIHCVFLALTSQNASGQVLNLTSALESHHCDC